MDDAQVMSRAGGTVSYSWYGWILEHGNQMNYKTLLITVAVHLEEKKILAI